MNVLRTRTMPFAIHYIFYMQFSKFLPVLSVIYHISNLKRVHKSFIVHLPSLEIELLQHKESFTFYYRFVGLTHTLLLSHF